ncbi:hypothetical protein [Lonsdalea britannica]|uniref:hypothetical protein n=1 Tax=Lonsdalea britannica TaxID=1082704 RepID=UPI0026EE874B|nr:hypothetical protein [Lonsdalea britannica]
MTGISNQENKPCDASLLVEENTGKYPHTDGAISSSVINLSTVHIQVNTPNMDLQGPPARYDELKKEKSLSLQI